MARIADTDASLVIATPDLAKAVERWQRHLASERRLAAKTLEAYTRDVDQFLRFLTGHLGGPPTLADMAGLSTTDIRAFWPRGGTTAPARGRSPAASPASVRSSASRT